jgi:hypothetical protein
MHMRLPGPQQAACAVGTAPIGAEFVEDVAGLPLRSELVRPQFTHLLLEQLQFTHTQVDMLDLLVEYRIHLATVRRVPVPR